LTRLFGIAAFKIYFDFTSARTELSFISLEKKSSEPQGFTQILEKYHETTTSVKNTEQP